MDEEYVVVGANGLIGSHFCKVIKPKYYTSRSNAPYFIDLHHPSIDVLPTKSLRFAIIAAACTDIAYCEKYPDKTYQINVKGILTLVKLFLEQDILPILFSSDYVFSGKEGNYVEDSLLAPTTIYGNQKRELEKGIAQISDGNYLILRLSKIYSLEKGGGTLLDEIADQLIQEMPIKAAMDQVFCPLAVDDLVMVTLKLVAKRQRGLFNLGGKDKISRFELVKKMSTALGIAKGNICPIALNTFDRLVSRPQNTSLISDKVFNLLNYTPICIEDAIDKIARSYRSI